jgi:hypothetical protein
MSFASNANYTAPVLAPDLGNATKVVPADLANGFVPEQPMAAEHVNYCLNKLCPLRAKFTANGTWTKPQGATTVRIVCVGGGGKGATGITSAGGKGGEGGEVIEMTFDADELASTLSVTVGSGSTSTGTGGGASYVQSGGLTLVCALGGATGAGFGGTGAPSDVTTNVSAATLGGDGGTNAAGTRGNHSRFGPGGAGGSSDTNPGSSGRGFGGGGGGGAAAIVGEGSGGGGGGGYGVVAYAGNASGSTGGNGASGVVYIFTSCDIV